MKAPCFVVLTAVLSGCATTGATVEVGQYWIRQRGFRGTKEVELGTDHVVRFPWLTSLEGPVAVLQLTGALVGRDGKAIRIGAEGLLARRTSMTVSALGAQALVTEDEIRQLRTERRDDLPGRPLVWQAGIRALVEQLTGRKLRPSARNNPRASRQWTRSDGSEGSRSPPACSWPRAS